MTSSHIDPFDTYTLPNTPPCARYEGGENNDRLTKVWTYVVGLVGGDFRAKELGRSVARIYDYKGLLVIATRIKLTPYEEALFRKAWVEVGCEFADQVEFADVRSERWEQLWNLRRFESDWGRSTSRPFPLT